MAYTVSAQAAATATMVAAPAMLLGIHWVAGATAGTVVLKDGGASGTTKLTLNTPADATVAGYLPIPGGMQFATDVHATITVTGFVTLIYRAE